MIFDNLHYKKAITMGSQLWCSDDIFWNILLDSILQKLFCKLVQSKELFICILLASFTLEKDLLFILLWSFTSFFLAVTIVFLSRRRIRLDSWWGDLVGLWEMGPLLLPFFKWFECWVGHNWSSIKNKVKKNYLHTNLMIQPICCFGPPTPT